MRWGGGQTHLFVRAGLRVQEDPLDLPHAYHHISADDLLVYPFTRRGRQAINPKHATSASKLEGSGTGDTTLLIVTVPEV